MPTTIWLPGRDQREAAPAPGSVLPEWAIEKIGTHLIPRLDRTPAPLVKVSVRDTEPGMDARMASETRASSPSCGGLTLLAELHPDSLPAPAAPAPAPVGEMPGAMEDGWPGFFHRAHRLLPTDGLLLLAARQRRDAGVLTDPLGSLVACARTAGFRYLQHIVVAHAHPVDDRLVPAPPADACLGVTHSDLIVLSSIGHA
ncbi:hypothetical protein [Streptomyces lycii]|uniref:hypothetical protein n=1 Tax=Streptomyces lycii TaxID=2654337 RepID=UPI001F40EA4A|nr:hypothetical protein [Streptomyces lycii]